MKEWRVPVTWEVCGCVKVEADTLEEAMIIAKDDDGVIPLPDESDYIDGSWHLSFDFNEIEEVRQCFNDNEQDEIVSNNFNDEMEL